MISVLQGRVARLLSATACCGSSGAGGLPRLGIDMVWNPRGTNDPACAGCADNCSTSCKQQAHHDQ